MVLEDYTIHYRSRLMNLIDKDALVAEIERRIEELQPCNTKENLRAHGAIAGYYQILSFINFMQEEPVSEDLEEATNNYCLNARIGYPRVKDETDKYICSAFKAGANYVLDEIEKFVKFNRWAAQDLYELIEQLKKLI